MEHQYAHPGRTKRQDAKDSASQAPNRPQKRSKLSQEERWVAEEDVFVLRQAHRRALIRVQEGRGKPSDWLCVALRYVNHSSDPFEDAAQDAGLDVVVPQTVLEELDQVQLEELAKDIQSYLVLEKKKEVEDFWGTMLAVCKDRLGKVSGSERRGRGVDSVSNDVEKLFSSKSIKELNSLEIQIKQKLRSNEPIDVEYWEHLLTNLVSWKARAKLQKVSRMVVDSQVKGLRASQEDDAKRAQERLSTILPRQQQAEVEGPARQKSTPAIKEPEPALRLETKDKTLKILDERTFLNDIVSAEEMTLIQTRLMLP